MKKPVAGQIWAMHDEVLAETSATGITRRVLAWDKTLMCVENTFICGAEVAVHAHPHEQITYIQSGEFSATVGTEIRTMKTGDTIYVAGNTPHALRCVSENGVAVDMFTPVREDFIR